MIEQPLPASLILSLKQQQKQFLLDRSYFILTNISFRQTNSKW